MAYVVCDKAMDWTLMAPPPIISEANSASAISSSFRAPAFNALTWWSGLTPPLPSPAALCPASQHIRHYGFRQQVEELGIATTMKKMANHGMVILLSAPVAGESCLTRAARMIRNSASIMTRGILAITAAFSRIGLTAPTLRPLARLHAS